MVPIPFFPSFPHFPLHSIFQESCTSAVTSLLASFSKPLVDISEQ